MLKKKLLALTVLGLLAFAPVGLFADDMSSGMSQMGMSKKMVPSANQIGSMDSMLKQLNMSDEQKTTIKSLINASRDELTSVREQIKETSVALREVMKQPRVDLDKVTLLADQQGDLMSKMLLEQAKLKNDIYDTLTPSQRDQLLQMREKMRGQMSSSWSGQENSLAEPSSMSDAPQPPTISGMDDMPAMPEAQDMPDMPDAQDMPNMPDAVDMPHMSH